MGLLFSILGGSGESLTVGNLCPLFYQRLPNSLIFLAISAVLAKVVSH
jgi:hypothetical protein